ncbi:hypothetical protein SAMN05216516_10513 [Izhakiella capsodis]|uniref:Uncharacterized protein n=1 Tax=Izhakiella capsodis TaxID=1367852 RepID=A0A1I4XUV4_9GAMM|nr:hypothetical protein [Izhakiella capsodis]SFN29537.1 hypothetical protein SAMN05216516_10513 [Izhakiella capsodis]
MADLIENFLNKVAAQLESKQVKVGFIDGATYPDGTSVASVATDNEYGIPENNQPPRPFFRNAIALHEKEWSEAVARGVRAGYPVEQVLELIGAKIQGDVQESIATLVEPALSPTTLHIRRTRKERPTESTKPLVDSKVMIGDVSYEVSDIEPETNS